MADSILRLKVESQEDDNKLKQAAQGLTRYVDECRKVGGTLEVVQKETLDYVRALGQMDTTSRTATGKLAEMKKAFTELSAQYKQMTDAEKQSPFGKALAASLDQLKTRIQEGKSQLDDINKSINGGGGLTGALDKMLGKVGLNVEGLMKFGGAAGAATTALKVAKDAFFASETSLDEWGRTVQSSQSLYQGFLSALNNSDISGFLNRMDEIVSAARDAYNAMDELGTFSAFQQRNVAKGRAGYAQALDEYRLNPTADNKQKLQQANQKVMNDLRESHDKTEAAYQAALRQIATERIKGKDMQDAFVKMFSEGNYGDLQAAKSSYKTGRGLNSGAQYYYGDRVYDGRVQDRSTGKWRDMSDTEKQQFEFARALSQVNDSQIKEVQALGAQSVAITEQIYQQDRAYNRLAGNNAPLRGGGGRSGGGKTTTAPTFAADSIAAQQALVQQLTKQWNEAGADVRDQYLQPLVEAEAKLKEMQNTMALQKAQAEGKLNGVNLWQGDIDDITGGKRAQFAGTLPDLSKSLQLDNLPLAPLQQLNAELQHLRDILETAPNTEAYQNVLQAIIDKKKQIEQFTTVNIDEGMKDSAKSAQAAASAFNQVGSALSSIEDPSAKVMAIVAQAIATIAQAYASALAADKTTKSNIWAFIGAAAASIASMTTTISQVHAATGYERGGEIKGNTYSGDQIPIMANAGEIILNRAQAGNLASQLQGNNISNLNLTATIKGEDIRLAINNNGRRTGRGEYVTTRFR